MLILGLNGGADSVFDSSFGLSKNAYHDTASVIIQDGTVIAGIEEERLIRIKHTNKIWVLSVQFCLEEANKSLADIDRIVVYFNQDVLNRILKQEQLNNPSLIEIGSPHKLFEHLFFREFEFCLKENQLVFVDHHTTHAATAYYMSGFSDSLVLTIDGLGDEVATNVIDVRNKRFDYLLSKPASDSLGLLYWEVIRFLGYSHFDEYKVMGLSPYGASETYKEEFKRLYTLLPSGDYSLHRERITELFNILNPRSKDAPFTQIHMDIAAALQDTLEAIVFHVLRHYQKLTGHTRLVISGGVGQNSSMNGKILYSGLFEEVFVPSFAGDSGCAYGAAAYVAHQLQPNLPYKNITHAYWGTLIDDIEVPDILTPWQGFVSIEKMEQRSEQVSNLIIGGAVIGWVQGRSEFGPRALGNRSIIADPRVGSHKETINAMIKMRESYRPFAPSVLVERVRDFFEVPGKQDVFPFMSFVLNVRPEWREQLPAITHVDGSARLQTVNKNDNPRYWELIETFGRKTGIPILLNTSFNNNAEPIVDSIDDAIVCYLTSGLNYLVVGDYLVTKKDWSNEQLATLIVSLPKAAVLKREDRYISYTERGFSHFLTWNYDASRCYPLSDVWYQVLQQSDGLRTLQQLMTDLGLGDEQQNQVFEELLSLWSDRLIILYPGNLVA
ncbi:carbamoyltransferase [Methylomonas sp. BW4-1]|uniref:carbamoyltransferase family protein n=1 Tax=Methylomonas sp. BW4-1 TaxID=3376685 RepID=UPI00404372E1